MPIFLSAGDKDEVATRKITDQSQHDMEHEGFKNLRYEHFDGGHQLYHPHSQAALDWFLEEKGKTGLQSSPTPFSGH
jgi:predicted esterase